MSRLEVAARTRWKTTVEKKHIEQRSMEKNFVVGFSYMYVLRNFSTTTTTKTMYMSKSTGVEIDRLSVYQFNITRNTHELLPIFRCLCLSFFAIPLIWFDCIMVDFAIFIRQRDLLPLVFCPAKSAFYHSQLEFCSCILCLCLASQMNAIFTVMVISVHIICIHKWCWWWYYRTRIQVHTSFTQPYTNSVNTNINMKRIYHSICTHFFQSYSSFLCMSLKHAFEFIFLQ